MILIIVELYESGSVLISIGLSTRTIVSNTEANLKLCAANHETHMHV